MSGENKAVRIALAGNPNCGKTTLFNFCTGANARTANWPGVTVSVESGEYRRDGFRAVLYDLPGIYGLDSRCAEEKGAQEFILSGGADVIVNVADVTALERSLYLTLKLKALGLPMVMALNMTDVLRSRGGEIDRAELERRLGIPVVESCARRGIGADELMKTAAEAARGHKFVQCTVPDKAEDVFALAGRIADACTRRQAGMSRFTEKADGVLCRPLTGTLVLVLIMSAVFFLTFTLGDSLRGIFDMLIFAAIDGAERLTAGADPQIRVLLCSAALPAVGAVVSFVPNLFVLYLCLALLDDSGYMPRAAFMADGVMEKLGLSGKAFLPMILGFGCSVPAILASRIEEGERPQKRLALAIPFIPCGARLPLCVMMAGMFFGEHPGLICAAVYVLGTAVSFALLKVTAPGRRVFGACRNSLDRVAPGRRIDFGCRVLCTCRNSSDAVPLVMEMPDFRPPGVKSVLSAAWRRVTEYLKKAGSLIFISSVVLHFLTCFGAGGAVTSPEDSFGGTLGKLIAPLLSPIGLGFWQIALALICAFGAKEMAVSSLTVLYGTSSIPALRLILTQNGFTGACALSFMVFSVLYIPCISTVSTVRAEHGWRTALLGIGVSLAVAYGVSFAVYRIALLI